MENKEQNTQDTQPAVSSAEAKKNKIKRIKIRAILSNIIVFLVIGFGVILANS